jgi:hypothetical protein
VTRRRRSALWMVAPFHVGKEGGAIAPSITVDLSCMAIHWLCVKCRACQRRIGSGRKSTALVAVGCGPLAEVGGATATSCGRSMAGGGQNKPIEWPGNSPTGQSRRDYWLVTTATSRRAVGQIIYSSGPTKTTPAIVTLKDEVGPTGESNQVSKLLTPGLLIGQCRRSVAGTQAGGSRNKHWQTSLRLGLRPWVVWFGERLGGTSSSWTG